MQVLGTFQSRDAADAVKDDFVKEGFERHALIVMSNRESADTPPEDAKLEVGAEGAGGFGGLEEVVGKAVLSVFGKKNEIDGDGFEGEGKDGALLAITCTDQAQADRAKALLERHHAGDIEIAEQD